MSLRRTSSLDSGGPRWTATSVTSSMSERPRRRIRCVSVHRRPRIALLSTGDELVESRDGADAPSGRIFNSNAYALTGELESIGGLVDYLGIVPDRPEALREAFNETVDAGYDVIL